MKDYSAMSDFDISHAVAKAIGFNLPNSQSLLYNKTGKWELFYPCGKPSDAWPIIVENRIALIPDSSHHGAHQWWDAQSSCQHYGIQHQGNPLRAAMICYLMMKDAEKGHG